MIIAIGSDHAGFELKKKIIGVLKEEKHKVLDVGAFNARSSDYPDYAEKVALALREAQVQRGILICGSGVGASIAANKIPGIRAALCHDSYSARQGVEDDDMNVLVLGSRVLGLGLARELIAIFLKARFKRIDRYQRRLAKVRSLEVRYGNTYTKR